MFIFFLCLIITREPQRTSVRWHNVCGTILLHILRLYNSRADPLGQCAGDAGSSVILQVKHIAPYMRFSFMRMGTLPFECNKMDIMLSTSLKVVDIFPRVWGIFSDTPFTYEMGTNTFALSSPFLGSLLGRLTHLPEGTLWVPTINSD